MMTFSPRCTAVAAALLTAAFAAAPAVAGPFLYYSYDAPDDATDDTFDNATAAVDPDVPAAIASDQSLALTEDADGDGARVGRVISSGDLNFSTQSWTAATWFQRNDTTNRDFILHIGEGDGFGGQNELYVFQESSSDNVVLQHISSGQDINVSGPAAAPGTWHHMAVVHDADAGAVRYFVDGALVGSDASFTLAMNQADPLFFGGQNATTGSGFKDRNYDGKLDDSAVWDAPLSTFAVESLVNGNLDPNAAPTKRSPDLFLYYSFEDPDVATDNLATDNSGNGRTGTLSEFGAGAATYVSDSPAGVLGSQALQLDVTDSSNAAELTRSIATSELNFSTESWTFAAWYKTDDTGANMLLHIGTGDGFGDDNELYLNVSGGSIDFDHYSGPGTKDIDLNQSGLDTAAWHHAAVAFDAVAGVFSFYVDGELVGADSTFALAMNQSAPLGIGAVGNANHVRNFNGLIDDAALWARTLNALEIQDLYTGDQLAFAVIPEPATFTLLGLSTLALVRRRA